MAKLEDVTRQIEHRLSLLTNVDTSLTKCTVSRDERIKAITDKCAPNVDRLTKRRQQLVDEITELYQDNRQLLEGKGGKTIVFRSGTLKSHFVALTVVIYDEKKAMAYAIKHRMLLKVTKLGKRTFVKDDLKKHPDFVNQAPGMHFDQPENLLIRLAKTQIEIKKELTPFRSRIN